MKKLLLTSLLICSFVTAYGQGRVAFANTSLTLITTNDTRIGGASGNTATVAGLYTFGLYVGVAGSSSNQLVLNITGANNAGSGRFSGGSPAPLAAPFDGGGSPLAFQIRAWSSFAGSTYEAAVIAAQLNPNVYFGASAIGQVTPTLSPTAQAPLFGAAAPLLTTGWVLSNVSAVPEPSSIALGLLGLGAVAFFRRRK